MAGTLRSPFETLPNGPVDPRLRITWRLLAGSFALLGLAGLGVLVANRPLGLIVVALIVASGAAAAVHQHSATRLEADRRSEAEHLARILQGLSRSARPEEIIAAVIADLGPATTADHVVIARRRPGSTLLEATLAGPRPGDPTAIVELPFGAPGGGVAGPDRGATTDWIEARLAAELGLTNTLAAPLRGADGTIGAIVLARRGPEPWSIGARRILRAASIEAAAALDRVASHRSAEARASTDALTGLPNRRYFNEFCALLAGRRRADDAVGVLMVDIDRFKAINDRYGHDSGDAVLRAVGGSIAGAVRLGDVPARFGGEEFAVLLRNPTERVATEVAERVRAGVAGLDLQAVGPPSVTVSVGVAVQRGPNEPIAELLARADRSLYRAKRAGRNRVEAA